MISKTAEYALQAVIDLALHPGCARTAQKIAEATGCSSSYVPKILHQLVHHGLVVSQRGAHGGYALSRSPNQVTAYEVVAAVEPRRRIPRQWDGRETPLHEFRRAGELLGEAADLAENLLRTRTIADLMQPGERPTTNGEGGR